jgi:glycine/D-amino acid oxidase-like deaminating enzyme
LRIGIIGAGVVGAAIAYELSALPNVQIQVFDQRPPQSLEASATGAALGVLIAVASTKRTSHHLNLRLQSLQRFETLIPELEQALSAPISYNRQGILELCDDATAWAHWQTIAQVRQQQGWLLELLSLSEIRRHCPGLEPPPGMIGAVYSPQDRQVNPVALTHALVQVAQQRGVAFLWNATIQHFQHLQDQTLDHQTLDQASTSSKSDSKFSSGSAQSVTQLQTSVGNYPVDLLIIAAGTGSLPLTQALGAPVDIRPVLGQALQLSLPTPLCDNWPVVQGGDVHLVPIDAQSLWVGATVEFPDPAVVLLPATASPEQLASVHQQALHLCPSLAPATVVRTWSGLRPRPQGRPAPIIEPLTGYENVWLATGHYRNGVLLAPITALTLRERIQQKFF